MTEIEITLPGTAGMVAFLEKLVKGISHQTILLACFGMQTGFSTIDIFGKNWTESKCYVSVFNFAHQKHYEKGC